MKYLLIFIIYFFGYTFNESRNEIKNEHLNNVTILSDSTNIKLLINRIYRKINDSSEHEKDSLLKIYSTRLTSNELSKLINIYY